MDYVALVRQKAAEMGIDPDIAESLMQQESRGNPNAVSPAGAVGLMQLMPATAKELGVDPTDPMQNIDGGLRYLKQQTDRFGIPGGLAAYNAGPGRFQRTNGDFNALPEETRNYVPQVLNRAAEISGSRATPEATPQAPEVPISRLMEAFQKAQAAGDKEASQELRTFIGSRFQTAIQTAQQAGDQGAVEELTAASKGFVVPTPAPKPTEAPKASPVAPKTPPKEGGAFKALQDFGIGAVDALSFGFADEGAALLASKFKGTKYEDELAQSRKRMDEASGPAKFAGQAATFLVPGIGAVRAAAGATKLARAGAGAATGAVQGGLYGAGSAEGDLGDRAQGAAVGAATGATLGGVLGGVLPATVRQTGNRIIKDAGSDAAAKVDAEIIRDINKVAGGANQRGGPVGATQLNALENKYIGDVTTALKGIGKKNLEKAGLKAEDISTAIRDRRIIGDQELAALRTTKPGTVLADAIEKAQRARSLTAPVPAATNPLARVGRASLDIAPLPQPLRYVGQRMLGSRQTREDVASKLVSGKTAKAADDVLQRLGPSDATQGLARLQQQAAQATAAAQAKAKAMAATKAAQQAQNLATRNQVLQQTRRPLGGAFQELLPGGRANTNLNSKQAIEALRILRGQGGPVGSAAEQILKSRNVDNTDAFYGLQNALRGLQERGVIQGAPGVSQAAASPVRNPLSYAEAVRTAGEAANLARQAAPNKELAQFATSIARIKNPSDKAAAVADRLAKASPEEAAFINQFVVPLTQFGAKGK